MKRIHFTFIVLAFLLFPLNTVEAPWVELFEVGLCSLAIATFGIAHGAIDNHLYGISQGRDNLQFILIYIAIAAAFGALWFIQADFAFLVFLLVSAFHFGQSQLLHLMKKQNWASRALFLLWGVWLLSVYLQMNKSQLDVAYVEAGLSLNTFPWLLRNSGVLASASSILLLATMLYYWLKGPWSRQEFALELYQMVLIAFVFYMSSPLLGFSLYFVILHALRVMHQEYAYLRESTASFSLWKFGRLLLPFTAVAILGMVAMLWAFSWVGLSLSLPLSALIFISCLSFPHILVMDSFYGRQHGKKPFET